MKLSVIIPVYNEQETVPILKTRLEKSLGDSKFALEIIIVDDGSSDGTTGLVKEWISTNPDVILLELSRNFGHQAAITAGLTSSTGDAVVILDADLQDPPELIAEMLEHWRTGSQIVLAERISRQDPPFRKLFFGLFYKVFIVFSELPPMHSGVFGLMDRRVVLKLLAMPEQNRYLPGMRSWVGFKTTKITYHRDPRTTGSTKQSLRRLFKYGLDAIFSFSYKPLRLSFMAGFFISMSCFIYSFILVVKRFMGIDVVHGFTTLAVAIFFLGGVILISNGILGEYLARIYDEVKRRPLYIITKRTSLNSETKLLLTEHI